MALQRIAVDATGVGEPVASFLRNALSTRVAPFTFTERANELGFNLLAAVNSGRLKVYKGDGSEEYKEFWNEMEKAKRLPRQPDDELLRGARAGPRRFFNEPGAGGGGGAVL